MVKGFTFGVTYGSLDLLLFSPLQLEVYFSQISGLAIYWTMRMEDDLRSLIEGLFCPEDATLIQSIPFGQFNWADTMIWHYNKNGKFFVKSASHLAQCIALEICSPFDSQYSTSSGNWQFIWSTKVPNKIKLFLRRLCREAIPTTSNLLRQRCVVEQAYLTCGVGDVTLWLKQVRKSLDDAQFNWFAIRCWCLWGRRSGLIMENKRCSQFYCITYASSLLSDFLNSVAVKPSVLPSRNVWQPPDRESIKVNFDAAVFDKGNRAGLGVIARDWKGTCLAWRTVIIPNICSPEHEEALAARLAIEVRCHGRWIHCIIEEDCLQVVNKL
ncbi:hypothetical protein Sango_3043000 [Sesamum angolense]|uniref:RNase H type-1 domain-containing protein n=1 Tax=Sesamum angolense TaxID=2727404 RepID=A0AAE1T9C1_9LAMI|nr:hypothetical protein Sango_3043000 [Sesamum angolense]